MVYMIVVARRVTYEGTPMRVRFMSVATFYSVILAAQLLPVVAAAVALLLGKDDTASFLFPPTSGWIWIAITIFLAAREYRAMFRHRLEHKFDRLIIKECQRFATNKRLRSGDYCLWYYEEGRILYTPMVLRIEYELLIDALCGGSHRNVEIPAEYFNLGGRYDRIERKFGVATVSIGCGGGWNIIPEGVQPRKAKYILRWRLRRRGLFNTDTSQLGELLQQLQQAAPAK